MNKDPLFIKAKEYYDSALYVDAVKLFDEIILNNPEAEECYFYAGRCYENIFYELRAMEYYLKGIQMCVNDEYISDYHLHIGNCLVMLSKISDAIFHYDEASKFDDNYLIAQANKAKAFVCIKEYKKALDIFCQLQKEDAESALNKNRINDYVKYCQNKIYKHFE